MWLCSHADFRQISANNQIYTTEYIILNWIRVLFMQMITRFRIENFRSFKSRQEISFVASKLRDHPEVARQIGASSLSVLPVAAVYGANASGKTNLFRALNFMKDAVVNSQRQWGPTEKIPRGAFAMDNSQELPSSWEIEFLIDTVRYQYGFVMNSHIILSEWLYAFPKGRRQVWFERKEVPERKITGSRANPQISELTRSNSLYLSASAQNNQLLPMYEFFSKRLMSVMGDRSLEGLVTSYLSRGGHFRLSLAGLIQAADLGIEGVEIEEEAVPRLFPSSLGKPKDSEISNPDAEEAETVPKARFLHSRGALPPLALPLKEESQGTAAYFALLGPVLITLGIGGVLLIDELDSSLHPLLALEIVKMFNDPAINVRGAQLIFNTHDTNLLDTDILRRDQIWFTEKDPDGATHLYPLSQFAPRQGANLAKGYLQGRYGAIPFLSGGLSAGNININE